jgi:alpha-beta hydrolase superfamily lysophospholipase
MPDSTFTLDSPGEQIHVYRWEPDGPVKAVVQVAHGMAEHAARYERFARALNAAGYAVYANDHRGHGRTAGSEARTGVFAQAEGWNAVITDMAALTRRIHEDHHAKPVFLLGHSMGSFLARTYAASHGHEIDGLVLSGTAGDAGALGKVGLGVARAESRIRGRNRRSPLLDKATFGAYNKGIANPRTKFDWLSRDPDEVDKYVADPYCGWVATAGFYDDLFRGLALINSDAHVASVRKDLPILLVAGDRDPVGAGGGKGPTAVAEQFRRAGVSDVSLTLYPGARHEILNETNRDTVTADIVAWLDAHLPG